MARRRSQDPAGIPPALVRLVYAARRAGEDPQGHDLRGVSEALREFGALAAWALPTHGLFVPNTHQVSAVIDRVAKQRLGLGEARRDLRDALKVVELFENREPIESAFNHVQAVSDEAYFYAGMAFGASWSDPG